MYGYLAAESTSSALSIHFYQCILLFYHTDHTDTAGFPVKLSKPHAEDPFCMLFVSFTCTLYIVFLLCVLRLKHSFYLSFLVLF